MRFLDKSFEVIVRVKECQSYWERLLSLLNAGIKLSRQKRKYQHIHPTRVVSWILPNNFLLMLLRQAIPQKNRSGSLSSFRISWARSEYDSCRTNWERYRPSSWGRSWSRSNTGRTQWIGSAVRGHKNQKRRKIRKKKFKKR